MESRRNGPQLSSRHDDDDDDDFNNVFTVTLSDELKNHAVASRAAQALTAN